jgi:hypothetical protein
MTQSSLSTSEATQELKKFLVFSAPNIRHYVHNSMTFKSIVLFGIETYWPFFLQLCF